MSAPGFLTKLIALGISIALFWVAREPELSEQKLRELRNRFQFSARELVVDQSFQQRVRGVNQSLGPVDAWVSSVGSSIAVGDLDGDGLPNDLCLVDTRTDLVHIMGVGEQRYPDLILPFPEVFYAEVMAPFGCRIADFDEDGLQDILVYYGGRAPVLFLHEEDMVFQPIEILPPMDIESWVSTNAVLADLNGDRHIDIVLGHYFQDDTSILDPEDSESRTVMPNSMARANNGGRNRFLLWKSSSREPHRVVYEEVDVNLPDEVLRGWTLGLGAADLNGDLLPEIYIANDFGPDHLLFNRSSRDKLVFELVRGPLSWEIPPSYILGRDSFKGMGAEFADVNQDGILDIYVSNVGEYEFMEGHYLFLSEGESMHPEAPGLVNYKNYGMEKGLSKSGWGWGVRMGDFDNDGTLEALQATGFLKGEVDQWPEFQELAFCTGFTMADISWWPRFAYGDDISGSQVNPFHVLVDGFYYDIASEIGLGEPYLARGIATSDVDGDGDLDLFYSNQWEPSRFYRNDCDDCGKSLILNLRWPHSSLGEDLRIRTIDKELEDSRPAFGAVAVLTRSDGKIEISQVDGGSGHSGQKSPQIHFGLGLNPPEEGCQIKLRWLGGEGEIRSKELNLQPGSYTVYLGG